MSSPSMPANYTDIEKRLWDAADSLRANSKLKASEYSVPVLGLIFLRYADWKFTQAEDQLKSQSRRRRGGLDKTDYQGMGVMYLPESARFSALLNLPEDADIGKAINDAMRAIEAENEDLRDVLPLATQDAISSILSAYDDLIENNTRRIQILEEMAQMLYQEWFVNFRFPGHEQAKFVESELGPIPEGWEVKKLKELAAVNASSIKASNAPEEINYVDIASVSTGKIEAIKPLNFSDAPSRARRAVRHGDVIWSTVRPNRKSYSLVLAPPDNLIASTGFAVLTAKKIPYTYLYQAVTTDAFAHYLTNNATGSAYPAVNTRDFKEADILVPEQSLVARYHEIAKGMLDAKQILHKKNTNLAETRDLLLPKLISGEIDVEQLGTDLEVDELAA